MPDAHPRGDEYLSLGEATKLIPGRPSANALWRWCRRGVLARSGQRVYLQHLRMGGRIVTRREWVEAFGRTLAAADEAHFRCDDETSPPPRTAPRRRRERFEQHRREAVEHAHRELEERGL